MRRLLASAAAALALAVPLGLAGAWAFNPDSGAVLHSEILWRIFGITAEGGLLLVYLAVLLGPFALLLRRARSLRSPDGSYT